MATGGQSSTNQEAAIENTTECVIHYCETCVRKKSSNVASVFCKECKELLCDDCEKPHTIYQRGKHAIVSLLDMDKELEVDMKSVVRCEEQVSDLASVSEHRPDIEQLMNTLGKTKLETDSIIADYEGLEHNLDVSITNIFTRVDEVNEMKNRINTLLEKINVQSLVNAKVFKTEESKRLSEKRATIGGINEEINELFKICSVVLATGTGQQKHIVAKKVDEKQKSIESRINEHRRPQINTNIPFSLMKELSRMLENGNKFMGLIENPPPTQTDKSASPSSGDTSDLFQELTLQQLVSVDIKQTEGDKEDPLISGLDFMQDGRLVVVDCMNKKCLILNERLQIQGIPYKFKDYPNDVVCLSKYEFAVTMGNKTVVLLFVSPDNVISLITELKTSSLFDSICCITRSNMVVSTFVDPRPVRMITVDGVESDFDHVEFPSKTYKFGESKCTYVPSKNTLVLTDRFAHTVLMYDTVNGTSRAFTDTNIKEPRGACVGPGDTVFVCSKDIHSIVHLTVDGDILGTYPVDMTHPFSLCMNRNASTLAVSNTCIGERKLQLYKISPADEYSLCVDC